eukprot:scaffold1900_cov389-Prasinococcus_capsulatus_cf.AAC.19
MREPQLDAGARRLLSWVLSEGKAEVILHIAWLGTDLVSMRNTRLAHNTRFYGAPDSSGPLLVQARRSPRSCSLSPLRTCPRPVCSPAADGAPWPRSCRAPRSVLDGVPVIPARLVSSERCPTRPLPRRTRRPAASHSNPPSQTRAWSDSCVRRTLRYSSAFTDNFRASARRSTSLCTGSSCSCCCSSISSTERAKSSRSRALATGSSCNTPTRRYLSLCSYNSTQRWTALVRRWALQQSAPAQAYACCHMAPLLERSSRTFLPLLLAQAERRGLREALRPQAAGAKGVSGVDAQKLVVGTARPVELRSLRHIIHAPLLTMRAGLSG